MIKLIATDIDGTLVDSDKQLPANFTDVINKLKTKNIRFTVASGRSYAALKEMFSNLLNDLTFICDNGAYIVDRGSLLSISVIDNKTVTQVVKFCAENKLTAILCGKNGTWHSSNKTNEHKEVSQYYTNQVKTDDLLNCNDEIFKIAVFEENGIENSGYPKLYEKFGQDLNVQISGRYWCDIMNKGITKGEALKSIQKSLGVEYRETMAFGDYLNDISLLENAYYSFAVANAHPKLKEISNFTTGSNNDNSVMKEIIKYCLI